MEEQTKQDVTAEVDFAALNAAAEQHAPTREITVTVKFRVPVKVTRRAVADFVNMAMDEGLNAADTDGDYGPANYAISKADAWSADGVKKQHGHKKQHNDESHGTIVLSNEVTSTDGTPAETAQEIANVALSFPGAPVIQGVGPVITAVEEPSEPAEVSNQE